MTERDPSASDAGLESAVEAFLDWAQREDLSPDPEPLPEEPVLQRVGPGVVLGDFELVRTLGTGSMGVVFEARQRSVPGRRVAVKVMRSVFSSARAGRRFQREIAVIGQLDHPGVVPVLAAGVESGVPYYAMKFVYGAPCSRIVRDVTEDPGLREPARLAAYLRGLAGGEPESNGSGSDESAAPPETWERWVAGLGARAADALQHAHDRGVIHRDVKPGNVLVTYRGRPVLCDFGLASQADDPTLTESGDFLGTLAYAGPEQLRGEGADARSDVYALGAMLYELLALRRPYDADTRPELLRRIERDELAALPARVPVELRTIVRCALSSSPRQRYASAGAMAADLRGFLDGRGIRARPPGPLRVAWRAVRRHPRVTALALVAVLVFGALDARDRMRARRATRLGAEAVAAAAGRLDHLRALAAAHERPWADGEPYDERVEIARRAALARTSQEVDAILRTAESRLGLAYAHVAGYGPARRVLADLHALRLAKGLVEYRDVFDPERLGEVAGALATVRPDDPALDPTGWLAVESSPPGARARLRTAAGWRDLGRTPLSADDVPEGEHALELQLPDRALVRTWVLVRRRAADAGAPHPSRTVHVELPPEDAALPGFVWVPAGWAFVDDEPPRRERVDGFWIQVREVSFADWIDWMNALTVLDTAEARRMRSPDSPSYKPRLSQRSDWEVEWDEGAGRWRLVDGVDPRWPVRGLALTDMLRYAETAHGVHGVSIGDLLPGLPTRAEWVRAARGPGARRWPWGDAFDYGLCANYYSGGEVDHEVFPEPVETYDGDVSPFGVRDLAGSVREATTTGAGQLRGTFLACGGSYRDTLPEALSIAAVLRVQNLPYHDLGFRMVLRPLPPWARGPGPDWFVDDFERPDSDTVGGGWTELKGGPFEPAFNPVVGEQCSLSGGRLVCRGGQGNFSQRSFAWRPVAPPPAGFRVVGRLSLSFDRPDVERGTTVLLSPGLGEIFASGVHLSLQDSGDVGLTVRGESRTATVRSAAPGGCLRFEIVARCLAVEARVWPDGAGRPAEPTLTFPVPDPLPPTRYLGVASPHFAGGACEVEELALLPLAPGSNGVPR